MKNKLDTQIRSTADSTHAVFLTPAELAARWKVTPMTLRRWRKLGKFKAAYFGRGVRISLEEVERFEKNSRA